MIWLIIYLVCSVIMSIVYTMTIVKATDISMFCRTTKICFFIYFLVANMLAWPVYGIYLASYILHDYEN